MKPERFYDPRENPVTLCAGCVVMGECRELRDEMINVSSFIAEFQSRVDGFDDLVPVSGVTMAGAWVPDWDGRVD